MKKLEQVLQDWEAVIGLEIHTELTTLTTKMFCGCKLEFGAAPNTHTCPVCLGLPGALPVPNKAAIESIVLAGLATNCDIEKHSMFYRKNYMYPDMAKNFQTTQGPVAFCMRGHLDLDVDGPAAKERTDIAGLGAGDTYENVTVTDTGYTAHVGITRIHMEEDAGKMVHIGGDEANYTHWQNSEEIQAFMKANGLPTCSDLQVWAINRMSKYLASKGCRMIGWNEITGDNVRGEAHVQASQSEKLAPGTIVQFWDGDISLVNKAIEKGYDVVNSNRFFTYLDYPYEVTPFEKAYSFNPIPDGLADADKEKILGTGCQMWGEFTPNLDRLYYQIFPRIAAYAECGWTPVDKKYYEDFRKRLKKIENIWKEKGYLKTQLDKY